jgi:hypothetical protein
MASKYGFLLDSAKIRENENKIAFPQMLEKGGIVESGESVFWAIDEAWSETAISMGRTWFEEDPFAVVGRSMVDRHRVATIPREAIEDWKMFEYGDPVFFVAAEDELKNGVCRIVTYDDMLDVLDREILDLFKPD